VSLLFEHVGELVSLLFEHVGELLQNILSSLSIA